LVSLEKIEKSLKKVQLVKVKRLTVRVVYCIIIRLSSVFALQGGDVVDDRFEVGWLFGFYGPLLTERQRKLIALYCEEDFSLSEIAAREGISRQAAYDAVRRGAAQLESYEKQLGLLARHQRMTQGLEESLEALRDAPGEKAEQARNILEKLLMQEEE
jgi:predicted DNA-binding protein YlxM (UPF0122 family)